jgi:hypothetical protein
MPKHKRKTNRGKTYAKRVTLYPLADEQAPLGLLKTPPSIILANQR